jgi:hypothetical protein
MNSVYNSHLSARVALVTYDPSTRIGTLHIDPRDSCDSRAAIRLFLKIDSRIAQVLAGDERGRHDRVYVRLDGDRWNVYDGYHLSYGAMRISLDAPAATDSNERL